ncbi:MAG: transglutaminase domain-containing protein [Patescibacteria group bacterium]|jgi:transglutaminase-like putative cysteine protease
MNKKGCLVWFLFVFLFLDLLAILLFLGLGVYLFLSEAPKEETTNSNTNEQIEEVTNLEYEQAEWEIDKEYYETKKYDLVETLTFANYGLNDAKNVEVWVALAPTINNYQQVLSREISPSGYELVSDENGNQFAKFTFNYMKAIDGQYVPEEIHEIKIIYQVKLASYVDYIDQCTGEKPNTFLDPEVYIESDDLEIMELARDLSEGASTDCEKAEIYYNYVADNMNYEKNITYGGALNAMYTELGDCTDYSDYYVALCRASGIPARFITGLVYTEGETDYTNMLHNWAEVYLPGTGWTQVDPTIGQPDYNRSYYFAAATGDQVIITRGRQPELLGEDYYFHYTYEDVDDGYSAVDFTEDWQFTPVLTDQ